MPTSRSHYVRLSSLSLSLSLFKSSYHCFFLSVDWFKNVVLQAFDFFPPKNVLSTHYDFG